MFASDYPITTQGGDRCAKVPYNRTILGWVDDAIEFSKFTSSQQLTYPLNSADPGPTAGRFPTDPYLVNGPFVNRALLNATFAPGALVRNTGDVIFDTPDRAMPYATR